jgi:4-hydroxy-tetrahydrodipicolinate reductase
MELIMKKIILIGNGKLANSIFSNLPNYTDIEVKKYNANGIYDKESIFVHIGSGREFKESLDIAIKSKSAFIQASTGKNYSLEPPKDITIKYIHAPNLDINIIKLIYWFKLGESLFSNETVSILESHQSEKTSEPGTAIKFANYLGVDVDNIESIRDKNKQKKLNITTLDHHAFHKISIGDKDSSINIETKIEGAISYSKGLARIVECINNLKIGKYEVEELVKFNLL